MGGGNGSSRKGATLINEAHGPTFRPVASHAYGSEYPETGRSVHTMPSGSARWTSGTSGRTVGPLAKSSKAYDTRAEANPGEPRAGHFNDAVHQATFAAVIKSRKTTRTR